MKLKELRKTKGISQDEVANALGITLRTYQNYEYGQREPNIEMINKIADFSANLKFRRILSDEV